MGCHSSSEYNSQINSPINYSISQFNKQLQFSEPSIINIKSLLNEEYNILKSFPQLNSLPFTPSKQIWIGFLPQNLQNHPYYNKQKHKISIYTTPQQVDGSIIQQSNNTLIIVVIEEFIESIIKKYGEDQKIIHIFGVYSDLIAGHREKRKWSKIKGIINKIDIIDKVIQQQSIFDEKYNIMPQYKILQNSMNPQHEKITKLRYEIRAMLKFRNISRAKEDFMKFSKHFFQDERSKKEIQLFQNQIKEQFDQLCVLKWYITPNSFYYGLLRKFLQSMKNPLDTYHIRFPFWCTFRSIKNISEKNKNREKLTMYKKCTLTQHELKHINNNLYSHLEIFEFFYASLDYQKIKRLQGNTILMIEINIEPQYQNQYNYGFVKLWEYFDDASNQKEVLFNALNTFQISKVSIENDINIITLKYAQLSKQIKSFNKSQSNDILSNYVSSINFFENALLDQGDILYYSGYYEQGLKYKQYFVEQIENEQIKANQFRILANASNKKSLYELGIQYTLKTLYFYTKLFGDNHKKTVKVMEVVAALYSNIGQFSKAQQFYKNTLKIKYQIFGRTNDEVVETLSNLGIVTYIQGYYDEALPYLSEALSIKQNNTQLQDKLAASIFCQIANIFYLKQQYNSALKYYQRTQQIFTNQQQLKNSTNSRNLVNLYKYIGFIYQKKQDYAKALVYIQKALKSYLIKQNENTLQAADLIYQIALLNFKMKNNNNAILMIEKCLTIKTKLIGLNHKNIAETMINTATIYLEMNKFDDALQHFERAFKIYLFMGVQDKGINAKVVNQIGITYFRNGDFIKALENYQKSLTFCLSESEKHIPLIITIYVNIGDAYKGLKKKTESILHYNKALQLHVKKFSLDEQAEQIMSKIKSISQPPQK